MGNDHEILGVPAGAEPGEIKKAYFKLVRQFSPENDPERFQEIRGAYERLMQGDDQEKEKIRLSMEMPDDPFAHNMFRQMTTLRQQGDYEGAAATAKEAVSRFGEHEAFLYELAVSQLYGGHSGGAVKNFEKLTKQYPEKTIYKRELALAYLDRGYGKKAFEAFEKAYEAGERDADFVLQFSLCCKDREEYGRGFEVLLEMVKGYDAAAKEDVQDYLEAYTGLFSLNYFAPNDGFGELLDLYGGFLKAAGRGLKNYSDLLVDLTMFMVKFSGQPGYMLKLNEVLAATKKILPERNYPEEWKSIMESLLETRIRMDERLDDLWDMCYEAYIAADSIYEDSSVIRFMQLDVTLLLLERMEELKPQFDIVKEEYPELHAKMKAFYDLLETDNLPYTMEKLRKNYSSVSKNIAGGFYYELYPQYMEPEERIQWDSFENGSYVRPDRKIGRNDPCPCGSGKKYKKCCGK